MAKSDYIKRSVVLKAIKDAKGYAEGNIVPSAKWIMPESGEMFIGAQEIVVCSNCSIHYLNTEHGMTIPMVSAFKYCPMCGAKMETEII